MLKSRLMKKSLIGIVAVLFLSAGLLASNFIFRAMAAPQPVIIELKSEPVVVAQALAEARGQNFDPLAYRQQLVAEQNQFLNQLSARPERHPAAERPLDPTAEGHQPALQLVHPIRGSLCLRPELCRSQ